MSTETPPAPDPAVIPFEKRRFRTAAGHYLQGRPAYAPGLIDRLVQLTGLGSTGSAPRGRVLDLGCGPGQLALALAPHAGEVVAVDPEPEMLRIAAENAAAAGLNIRFVEGSSAGASHDNWNFGSRSVISYAAESRFFFPLHKSFA